MVGQLIQKKEEEKQIEEEQAANAQYWKIPACYDDDDVDYAFAITSNEPDNSLSMGDEHLNTISATKSDEFIKSSVENLVPIPSEPEGENECDMPACENYKYPLLDTRLRFGIAFCVLRFGVAFCLIEDLIAFCLGEALPDSKLHCVLSQLQVAFCHKTVAFCLKTVAFCLKTHCVLSKNSLRFVSKPVAFCVKIHCVSPQNSLRFASGTIA
nr:hypothetical protein [Tanacetum cinerariifolium]